MSLTITAPTYPQGFMPSENDIVFSVLSTVASQQGFAYLIDVVVNGTVALKLRRLPIVPSQAIKINLKPIVQNFMGSIWPVGSWTSSVSPETAEVFIRVSESYGGDIYNTTTSVPIFVWNAAAQFEQMKKGANNFIYNFLPKQQSTDRNTLHFLGYHDDCDIRCQKWIHQNMVVILPYQLPIYTINYNLPKYISYFPDRSSYLCLAGFNEKGLMLKKYVHDIAADGTLSKSIYTRSLYVTSNIGGSWLRRYKLDPAADEMTMDDCKYLMLYPCSEYEASCNRPDVPTRRPLLFEVTHCPFSYNILYKSSEGCWGNITVNHKTEYQVSTETKTITNAVPYTWDDSSRIIKSIDVKAQGQWTLNTGWIEGNKFKDIEDLIISPDIYIQYQPDVTVSNTTQMQYIPVQLTDADYVTKETNSVHLRNYELKFKESFYKNTIKQ